MAEKTIWTDCSRRPLYAKSTSSSSPTNLGRSRSPWLMSVTLPSPPIATVCGSKLVQYRRGTALLTMKVFPHIEIFRWLPGMIRCSKTRRNARRFHLYFFPVSFQFNRRLSLRCALPFSKSFPTFSVSPPVYMLAHFTACCSRLLDTIVVVLQPL